MSEEIEAGHHEAKKSKQQIETNKVHRIDGNEEILDNDLQRLLDAVNTPIFGVNNKGNINEWNLSTTELTGYTKDAVVGKSLISTFISSGTRAYAQQCFGKALKGFDNPHVEVELTTKSNSRKRLIINIITKRNSRGDTIGGKIMLLFADCFRFFIILDLY